MVFRKSAIELAVPAKHKTKCEHQPEALPKRQFKNIMVFFTVAHNKSREEQKWDLFWEKVPENKMGSDKEVK